MVECLGALKLFEALLFSALIAPRWVVHLVLSVRSDNVLGP